MFLPRCCILYHEQNDRNDTWENRPQLVNIVYMVKVGLGRVPCRSGSRLGTQLKHPAALSKFLGPPQLEPPTTASLGTCRYVCATGTVHSAMIHNLPSLPTDYTAVGGARPA